MSKKVYKAFSKLRLYHIIILGCILCSLYFLKSNPMNKQQSQLKLRKLAHYYCSYSYSLIDDLVNYYRTEDSSILNLDSDSIDYQNKDKDYIRLY